MSGRVPLLIAWSLVLAACSSSDVDEATSRPAASTETVGSSVAPTADSGAPEPTSRPASEPSPPPDPPAPIVFEPAPIEWDTLNDAVDATTVEVPVDYADPDGPRFELFLARYRALDPDRRIGTLLVNPGGPGFGGSDFALFASQFFDVDLLERFDIVGWDPRGTGESDPPIDCIDDWDPFFTDLDGTPESVADRDRLVAVDEEFAAGCVERSGGILTLVGTNNSARDMDTIRRALGEEQISYFGFSYGSELGATWTTMYPDTVRAAVFDGASDPNADELELDIQQMRGFESSLTAFLARCSADDECQFHNDGDAEGAFDELMASLDAAPIDAAPDRPRVNRDLAITAVQRAMYSESLWPALERSLAEAAAGDGSGLLALHDSYYRRSPEGTYGNELEAFQAISCADTAERPSVEETDAETAQLTEVAPRLVPAGSAGGYFCNFFPDAIDPRIAVDAAGAGPIVVIATTGDPATPFDSTVLMADALEDARLVIVEAYEHTGYGLNRCVVDVVNDYLIDLEPPEDRTECR